MDGWQGCCGSLCKLRVPALNSAVRYCVSFCGVNSSGINVKLNRTRDARTWRAGMCELQGMTQCQQQKAK